MRQDGEFEIVKGVVHADPNLALPQFAQDLLDCRNALVEALQVAENWAAGRAAEDLVARVVVSPQIDDDTKIRMLAQMPAEDLPAEINGLLHASKKFAEAQEASQASLDLEGDSDNEEAGVPTSKRDVRDGLQSAYLRLLESYSVWGGYRYHGWTSQNDPRNYYGPAVWSEHDCVHQFAVELEKEFPTCVHTEFKINKAMRADYDPLVDPHQAIDLVISDLSGLHESESSQIEFRTWDHDVFIEAKWLKKGRWTKAGELVKRATDPAGGIVKDLRNLARALEIDRCKSAAVLIFDDECFLDFHGDLVDWPEGVEKFILSPTELKKRGMGGPDLDANITEIDRLHRENCACRKGDLKVV